MAIRLNDLTYWIIDSSELSNVDFNEVLQTSADTVRYSVDGSRFLVKYAGREPSSIEQITLKEGPYTHEQITQIVTGTDWNPPINT